VVGCICHGGFHKGGGGVSGIDDYCNRLKKLFCQIFYLVCH